MVYRGRNTNCDILIGDSVAASASLDIWIATLTGQPTADFDVHVSGTPELSVPCDLAIAKATLLVAAFDTMIGADGYRFVGLDACVVDAWSYGSEMSALDGITRLAGDGDQISGVIKGAPKIFQYYEGNNQVWARFGFAVNLYSIPDHGMRILVGDARLFREIVSIREKYDLNRSVVTLTRRIQPEKQEQAEDGNPDAALVTPKMDNYVASVLRGTSAYPESFWQTIDDAPMFDLSQYELSCREALR